MRLGGAAASIAGSAVVRKVGSTFKSEEEKRDALRDALVGQADNLVKTMGEMKGAAMKLGQMLSVAPDVVPREFAEKIKSLQAESVPMPFEMVSEEIEKALGLPLVEIFRYFDPEPIGAASIGQVHEARLFDGRRVAVKVQYPDIVDTLDADLKNLGNLAGFTLAFAEKGVVDGFLEEIREGILDEADYEKEAASLKKYGAILSEHPEVVVPTVVDEYSSKTVLTMDFLEGQKLDEAVDALETQAEKDKVGFTFSAIYVWMFHEKFLLHADPHPGNFLLTADGKIGILDFGCVREYDAEFCDLWLDVLITKWQHRKEDLPKVFEKLGYVGMRGSAGASERQLNEIAEITLAPFLYDRTFDWGQWHPQEELNQFFRGNLGLMQYASPPKSVFYFRVALGVWGFLQRSHIKGNWYALAHEVAQRRGKL
jgi:predicted unusual protein kinase regulating ubiquinone biosynthesis (AarF/ABC1/UbiB family)